MTEIFAYFRAPLATDDIEDEVAAFAAGYGVELSKVHVFGEAVAPVSVLWTLLTTMDRAHATAHSQRVVDYASRRGTRVEPLVNSPAPCPALWTLIATVIEVGGGVVLVPDHSHLDGFGAPSRIVAHVLASLPSTQLIFLTPNRRS